TAGLEAARRPAGVARRRARAVRLRHLRRRAAAPPDDAGGAGGRDGGFPARDGAAGRAEPPRARPARAALARGREPQVDRLPATGEGFRRGGVAPCVLTTSAASCSTWTGRWCIAPATRRTWCRARPSCWSASA